MEDKDLRPILRGDLRHVEPIQRFIPKSKLMLLVSSTFTDTHKERNILLEEILPVLQEEGRKFGILVVFVDMRYGLKDENTLDHMTWIGCAREIRRCYDESEGTFFLSLQALKYGYRPLPKYLPSQDYQTISNKNINDSCLQMLHTWYQLDENQLPPHFILKNLSSLSDNIYWNDVLPSLRNLLEGFPLNPEEYGPFVINGNSVTDFEFQFAKYLDPTGSRFLWLQRHFQEEITKANDPKQEFNDAHDFPTQQRLKHLLEDMRQTIPPARIRCSPTIPFTDYLSCRSPQPTPSGMDYLRSWRDTVSTSLREELLKISASTQAFQKNALSTGISGSDLSEILHHSQLAASKSTSFFGREEVLADCLHKLDSYSAPLHHTDEPSAASDSDSLAGLLGGISLCVIGRSGAGKTALLSRLFNLLSQRAHPPHTEVGTEMAAAAQGWLEAGTPVLIRFCGTSAGSSDAMGLMRSICLQLSLLFPRTSEEAGNNPFPTVFEEAVRVFQQAISRRPLVLIVDSLDQLSDYHGERSLLSFLAGCRPHPSSRIVVSSLPDERDPVTGVWTTCFQTDSRLREAYVPRVTVPPLNSDSNITRDGGGGGEVRIILSGLMMQQSRTLTEDQWHAVTTQLQLQGSSPSPLYLKLLTRLLCQCRSADPPTSLTLTQTLPRTVEGVLGRIVDSLERDFGRLLVQRALGFLTFSVQGVSDIEMQDLLTLSDDLLEQVFQYSKPEGVTRVPLHVWLRLKAELEGLIVERTSTYCWKWYHRQLQETMESRYTPGQRSSLQRSLGVYFCNLVPESLRTSRLIRAQPLTLNDTPVWFPDAMVNERRCVEGTSGIVEGKMFLEGIAELCDFNVICGSVVCGQGFHLLRLLIKLDRNLQLQVELQRQDPASCPVLVEARHLQRVQSYLQWLRQDMTVLMTSESPRSLLTHSLTTSQALNSVARNELNALLRSQPQSPSHPHPRLYSLHSHPVKGATDVAAEDILSKGWWRGRTLGGRVDDGPLYMSLSGHKASVTSVAISRDGSKVASGSRDKTIRVWLIDTGESICTLIGHTDTVNSVAFTADASRVVSGSNDKTIREWDAQSGEGLCVLEGHTEAVMQIQLFPDNLRLLSCSSDGTVRIWGLSTHICLAVIEAHEKGVTTVCLHTNGLLFGTGSWDQTAKMWSLDTSVEQIIAHCLSTLTGHSKMITSMHFTSDASTAVTASWDYSIRLWTIVTGECLLEIPDAHGAEINAVMFYADGKRLVSCSEDTRINIWEADTGRRVNTFPGHSEDVNFVAVSPDESVLVSGSADCLVKIWRLPAMEGAVETESHAYRVTCMDMSTDDTLCVTGAEDSTVRVWDLRSERCVRAFTAHEEGVSAVCIDEEHGVIMTSGGDNLLKAWDIHTGEVLYTLEGHTDTVNCIAFVRGSNSMVSGGYDKTLRVWDLQRKECTLTMTLGNTITEICVTADGTRVVAATWEVDVEVWEWQSGTQIALWKGHKNLVECLRLTADGKYAVSGSSDRTMRVWEVETGRCVRAIEGHPQGVSSVAITRDGSKIVSGCSDPLLRIWDFHTGTCIAILIGHVDYLACVSTTSDGTKIVSTSWDLTVKVWDMVTSDSYHRVNSSTSISTATSVQSAGKTGGAVPSFGGNMISGTSVPLTPSGSAVSLSPKPALRPQDPSSYSLYKKSNKVAPMPLDAEGV